jgi:bifunctional non-homologous end joining protein LigD
MIDRPPGNTWSDMPTATDPMLALPSGEEAWGSRWASETMWDGLRAIAYCQDGEVKLQGANGEDITPLFPEVEGLGKVPRVQGTVLDGELVPFDQRGLTELEENGGPGRPFHSLRSYVATYVIFDVLWDRGTDMRDRTYRERRHVLERMGLNGKTWRVPGYMAGGVPAALAESRRQGLPGLVVKRLDSPYRSGTGHRDWFALRNRDRQEFVIGGWLRTGEESESPTVGLCLGYWEKKEGVGEVLCFAGVVSAGFSDGDLELIAKDLESFERHDSPFHDGTIPGDGKVQFVNPYRVVEVEFDGWDDEGRLKEPVFVGMRRDRDPGDTRREPAR